MSGVQVAAAQYVSPCDAYRREARRLRGRYAGRPGLLQQSLKRLAQDARPTRATPASQRGRAVDEDRHPTSAQSGSARRFADHLAEQMPSSVLRYSQRLELLRAARRFGVGRFEANLLIAAVLERRRSRAADGGGEGGGGIGSVAADVAVFLVFQCAMLLGAWWVLFR